MDDAIRKGNGGKKKKILMSSLLAVIVIVMIFAAFRIVLATNPKLAFLYAVDKELKRESEIREAEGSILLDALKGDMLERSFVSETKAVLNIEVNGENPFSSDAGGLSLDVRKDSDAGRYTSHTGLILSSCGESIFELSYYRDLVRQIIDSQALYERPLSVRHIDLKDVLNRLGTGEDMPDDIITGEDIREVLEPYKDDYIKIRDGYKKYMAGYFDREEFSIKRDSTVSVAGREINCREAVFTTSGERMAGFLYDLSSKVKDDEEARSLLAGCIDDILRLLQDKGYEKILFDNSYMQDKEGFPEKSEILEMIDEASIKISGFFENLKLVDLFTITLYLDSRSNMIKYEVKGNVQADESNEDSVVSFTFSKTSYGTSDGYSERSFYLFAEPRPGGMAQGSYVKADLRYITIPLDDGITNIKVSGDIGLFEDNKGMFESRLLIDAVSDIGDEESKKISVTQGMLVFKKYDNYSDSSIDLFRIDIDRLEAARKVEKNEEQDSLDLVFTISAGEDMHLLVEATAGKTLSRSISSNLYDRSAACNMKISFNGFDVGLDLTILQDIDFTKEPSIPDMEGTGYVEVGSLSDSELEALRDEILGNIAGAFAGGYVTVD